MRLCSFRVTWVNLTQPACLLFLTIMALEGTCEKKGAGMLREKKVAASHNRWWLLLFLAPSALLFHWAFSFCDESLTQYQLSSVSLTEAETESLSKLGLTKKDPVQITDPLTGATRTIYGRFLHVTDFHPDPHYKPGSNIDRMCHSGKGEAGKYGDAIFGCDSPLSLVELTLDWIEENLHDKIDFIVWTGDNMRHDNDRNYPRTETDIFDMNEQISDIMYKKFGTLPIPSLGNNDVYPHNLFAPGPTLQTREFFKIWRPFVPQLQLHIFARGAYFFQEVVPSQLAVLSINTLYLFQLNPLVDLCDSRKDPGYKLFEWLGVVLKEMRKRGMKVWLTGHVPPNAKNYDISCLRKYVAWSHEYRDVIIGGLYGHMNIDHFIPLDLVAAYKSLRKKFAALGYDNYSDLEMEMEMEDELATFDKSTSEFLEASIEQLALEQLAIEEQFERDTALDEMYPSANYDSLNTSEHSFSFQKDVWAEGGIPLGKVGYMNQLRETLYAAIKKKKRCGKSAERYSIAHVATSVVPTFNPGIRVWEYNITDLHSIKTAEAPGWDVFFALIDSMLDSDDREYTDPLISTADKVEMLKKDKTMPPKMPAGLPLGPAYEKQLFTPERYVQYFLDLKGVNKGKEFQYEIEYATDEQPLNMKDLTVSEWLKLGRRLGEPIREKKNGRSTRDELVELWKAFLSYTFVSSDYENLGYG